MIWNLRIGIISYYAARITSSSSSSLLLHLWNINGEIVTLYGYVCRSFLVLFLLANWIKVVGWLVAHLQVNPSGSNSSSSSRLLQWCIKQKNTDQSTLETRRKGGWSDMVVEKGRQGKWFQTHIFYVPRQSSVYKDTHWSNNICAAAQLGGWRALATSEGDMTPCRILNFVSSFEFISNVYELLPRNKLNFINTDTTTVL